MHHSNVQGNYKVIRAKYKMHSKANDSNPRFKDTILPWELGLATPLFFLGHRMTNTCLKDMGIFVPKQIY